MAIERVDTDTKLTLRVNTGTQANPVYKNRIFNYINPETLDGTLYNVGTSLGELQTHTLDKLIRTDASVLINNE